MGSSSEFELRVEGMTCGKCVGRVQKVLAAVEGVSSVEIDLEAGIAHIVYSIESPTSITSPNTNLVATMIEAVRALGYQAAPFQKSRAIESSAILHIGGMSCGKCVSRVEKAILAVDGVLHAAVDLATERATLTYRAASFDILPVVIKKVEVLGFEVGEFKDDLPPSIPIFQGEPRTVVSPLRTEEEGAAASLAETRQVTFAIEGMTCASCVGRIEKTLLASSGVISATVTLATNSAVVQYLSERTSRDILLRAVTSIGYSTDLLDDSLLGGQAEPLAYSTVIISARLQTLQTPMTKGDFAVAMSESAGVLEVTDSPAGDAAHWTLKVKFDEEITGPRDLLLAAEDLGVEISISSVGGFMRAGKMSEQHSRESSAFFRDLLLCLLCTLPILIIGMAIPNLASADSNHPLLDPFETVPGMNAYGLLLFLLCTPVEFCVGIRFHLKAIETIRTWTMGMDFLVSTGTGAAYLYSLIAFGKGIVDGMPYMEVEYFETSAVLITVVLLGKYLECVARGRTAAAIHELASRRAQSARLVSPSFRKGTGRVARRFESDPEEAAGEASVWGRFGFGRRRKEYAAVPLQGSMEVEDVAEFSDADAEIIDISLVHKGDVLRLVAGETIPADGVLISEKIDVDESMITGESLSVSKTVGSKVFGGTIVAEGSGLMQVEVCGDKATLGKILMLVQDAQSSRPAIQEVADQIASYFVPTVAAISLLTFICWVITWEMGGVPHAWMDDHNANAASYAFYFALSVWVSACPCAFGLATPTAILVGSGVAAKHGILFRKGAALQLSSEIKTIAFDKTGTLTLGKIQVTDCVYDSEALSRDQLRRHFSLILSVESRSSHPIAKGIAEYCSQRLHDLGADDGAHDDAVDADFESVIGKGVRLTVRRSDGTSNVTVGSLQMLSLHNILVPESVELLAQSIRSTGKIVVFVAIDDTFAMLLGLGDQLRPEARTVLDYLRSHGIECHMVTGDNVDTAEAIGAMLDIPTENIFAGASPASKEQYVEELQRRVSAVDPEKNKVAFVGDGTNDTPALSKAQVGFVMSTGTDLALECGDVVLCKNSLEALVVAIDLSTMTMRRIYINYFWALVYNCILIPIAAGVLLVPFNFKLNPMIAGGAMAVSSVSVVLSSLMLSFYKAPNLEQERRSAGGEYRLVDDSAADEEVVEIRFE